MALPRALQALLDGPNFAALTTLGPDGAPSTHVMWVDGDADHVVLNTEVHRQKFKNVQRDPRVAVTVIDRNDPYRFVEVRGRVVATVGGDEARAHIDQLSQKYTGGLYTNPIGSERVILRVEPDRIVDRT